MTVIIGDWRRVSKEGRKKGRQGGRAEGRVEGRKEGHGHRFCGENGG